ncbi:7-carboxy-7-deazaguanine synthase QueE [Kitasatospora sp. NPDC059327]|uniref:7-carboxy-7-deazaguanine synthase QueE n=1 Tax=Kitasatospora sp. NPDC059327 TaxID=3346803 RepID=UPI0036A5A2B5
MTTLLTDPRPKLPLRVRITEKFRDTVQGEGPSTGRRAAFIRCSGCNLACGWCDTPETWDSRRFNLAAESSWWAVDDLIAWALEGTEPILVITGGEPLLQPGVVPLAERLIEAGRTVEFETNGTLAPPQRLVEAGVHWNVSPKLSGARVAKERRIVPETLRAFAALERARFKFAVTALEELDEIEALEAEFGLDPVWVMPEGTNREAVRAGLQELAQPVIDRGWNLSGRLHIEIWGNRRGK